MGGSTRVDAITASQGGTPAQLRELRTQGKRTVRRLLNAGMKVFDDRGYQAARVDDVVKAARTSHGTFYLYFANKEDLFRVLATDCVEAMTALAGQLPPVTADDEGYQHLRDWLAEFVNIYGQHGPVIRAWADARIENRQLDRLGWSSMDALTSAIADRISESGRNGIDPRPAAIALVAMVERLNYYVASRGIEVDRDEMLDTLATIAHTGMFGATRRTARAAGR